MAAAAKINPEIVRWARERAGLSLPDIADKVAKGKLEKATNWESGAASPTFEQARSLAKVLHIPFAFLFFEQIPGNVDEALPDFRTVGSRPATVSLNLRAVLEQTIRQQLWLKEFRESHGYERISLIGSSAIADTAEIVADRIARTIGPSRRLREISKSPDDYIRNLVEHTEDAGFLVVRTSYVGNETRRSLDPEEFRGFAIADHLAPAIFINTADISAAQAFTIIHEIAHLAIGAPGISSASLITPPAEAGLPHEEAFCNVVAAEYLVPRAEFESLWSTSASLLENAQALGRNFRVSYLVIARRGLDLGLVERNSYWAFVQSRIEDWRRTRDKLKEADGGPSHLVLVRARNGGRFTDLVVAQARSGKLLYRDAARLLGTSPKNIDRLAERKAVG